MYANVFIPAQYEELGDSTLARTLSDYREFIAAIPPPLCSWEDDPAAEMRARLEEAIAVVERELQERVFRRGGVSVEQAWIPAFDMAEL